MKKFLICLIVMSFCLPSHAFFWNKKNKALEKELQGKGYAGTLPNLENKIEKSKTKVVTPIFESQDGFNDPSDLKPVPKDNPAFINIIQKKDKTSQFLNDANEVIPMLDNLTEKYNGKPESFFESFRKLQEVNRYVKSISQLRREAVTYQRYLAYSESGSIYNPENINQQLEYLLEKRGRGKYKGWY